MTTKSVILAAVEQVPLLIEGRITYHEAVVRIKAMCQEFCNSTEYLVVMLCELVNQRQGGDRCGTSY